MFRLQVAGHVDSHDAAPAHGALTLLLEWTLGAGPLVALEVLVGQVGPAVVAEGLGLQGSANELHGWLEVSCRGSGSLL